MTTIEHDNDPFAMKVIEMIENRNKIHVFHSYLPEVVKETLTLQYFTLGQHKPRFTHRYDAEMSYNYLESTKKTVRHYTSKVYLESKETAWEDYVQYIVQQSGKSSPAVEYVLTRLGYIYLDKSFRNVYEIRHITLDDAMSLVCPNLYSKTPTLRKFLKNIEKYEARFCEKLKRFLTIRYIESIAYQDTTAFFDALAQEITWMIVAYYAKKLFINLGDFVFPGSGLYWLYGSTESEPYYKKAHYELKIPNEFTIPLSENTEITEHHGKVTVYTLEYPNGTVLHVFPEHLYNMLRNLYTAVERAENRLATHLGFRKAEYLGQHESIKYLVKHYDKEEIMNLDFRDGFGNVEDLISSGYVPPSDHALNLWSTHQVLNALYKDFVCQQQTFLLVKALQDNSHDETVLPLDIAVHIASTPEFESTIQEIETIVNDGEYPEIIEHPDGILEFTGASIKT